MLTHVTLGTNDLDQSCAFYDATMATIGIQRMVIEAMRNDDLFAMWGNDRPVILARYPLDGEAATHANGGTIGFAAPSKEAVDTFHAAGLANHGSCEGPPGPREAAGGAYGAYLRDPAGNKMCVYFYG